MSRIRADKIANKDGTGAVQLQYGAEVPVGYGITGAGTINLNGNIQSANLSGGGAGITGINASNISSGTIGAARLPSNLNTTGTAGGLTGTPNISVGTINASGDVSIGGTLTYEDVTNIDSVGLITARSGIKVGTGVTIESNGQATYTGIVTASAYYGDGSNLTGVGGGGGQGGTAGTGSWTATAGVLYELDNISINNLVSEYILYFDHSGSNTTQAQKVLVLNNGVNSYIQEYGVVYDNNLLVSVGSSISQNKLTINAVPETGITGGISFKFLRNDIS